MGLQKYPFKWEQKPSQNGAIMLEGLIRGVRALTGVRNCPCSDNKRRTVYVQGPIDEDGTIPAAVAVSGDRHDGTLKVTARNPVFAFDVDPEPEGARLRVIAAYPRACAVATSNAFPQTYEIRDGVERDAALLSAEGKHYTARAAWATVTIPARKTARKPASTAPSPKPASKAADAKPASRKASPKAPAPRKTVNRRKSASRAPRKTP